MLGEKMSSELPVELDVKQPNTQRYIGESCLSSSKLTSEKYVNAIGQRKNNSQYSSDTGEEQSSDSLGISFNVPLKLKSSQFFSHSSNRRRRAKSINDLGELILKYSAASNPGNLLISPSGRLIIDSIAGTVMEKSLVNRLMFFQLPSIDHAVSQVRSKPASISHMQCSDLTEYPSLEPHISKVGKRRSKSIISEEIIPSCSSSSSAFSYKSFSCRPSYFTKGILHCVWKSGIPYFVFSVDNGCGEVYVGNPQKIESSACKTVDFLYLFHSLTDDTKESREKGNNALDFVGKMKVSSSLILDSKGSRLMETEFILYAAHDDHPGETQSSRSVLTKSKGLSKKVSKIFRPNHSFKHKSARNYDEPTSFVGKLNDYDKPGPINHLADHFLPRLELAAIVVKDYQHCISKEVSAGGWGLKFLEKVEVTDPSEPSLSSKVCEGNSMGRTNSVGHMNVLVPAGFHACPVTKTCGPSSLIDRWKSGGHCDCGGWDIGCPLTVLTNKSIYSESLSRTGLHNDCKSLNLFIEGANRREPSLRMVHMKEDVYCIYFESTLSALQSFSIGVATVHSRKPGLYPIM